MVSPVCPHVTPPSPPTATCEAQRRRSVQDLPAIVNAESSQVKFGTEEVFYFTRS